MLPCLLSAFVAWVPMGWIPRNKTWYSRAFQTCAILEPKGVVASGGGRRWVSNDIVRGTRFAFLDILEIPDFRFSLATKEHNSTRKLYHVFRQSAFPCCSRNASCWTPLNDYQQQSKKHAETSPGRRRALRQAMQPAPTPCRVKRIRMRAATQSDNTMNRITSSLVLVRPRASVASGGSGLEKGGQRYGGQLWWRSTLVVNSDGLLWGSTRLHPSICNGVAELGREMWAPGSGLDERWPCRHSVTR